MNWPFIICQHRNGLFWLQRVSWTVEQFPGSTNRVRSNWAFDGAKFYDRMNCVDSLRDRCVFVFVIEMTMFANKSHVIVCHKKKKQWTIKNKKSPLPLYFILAELFRLTGATKILANSYVAVWPKAAIYQHSIISEPCHKINHIS